MKTFRFRFSKLMIALLVAALALCAAGFVLNVWRFFKFGADGFYDALQYGILFLVTLFCPILILSMLFSSRYTITEDKLITKFGLIKSKYALDAVDKIEIDKAKGKLSLHMKDGTFMVIVTNPSWHDDFVAALRETHPNIDLVYIDNPV